MRKINSKSVKIKLQKKIKNGGKRDMCLWNMAKKEGNLISDGKM